MNNLIIGLVAFALGILFAMVVFKESKPPVVQEIVEQRATVVCNSAQDADDEDYW
jgi:hypothetical protein